MTDQELADAIRDRCPVGTNLDKAAQVLDLLRDNPPAVPDPPCTIDLVPGWTVHVDANGEQFATNLDRDFGIYRRSQNPDGLTCDGDDALYPWPDPPLYQPGDLVNELRLRVERLERQVVRLVAAGDVLIMRQI